MPFNNKNGKVIAFGSQNYRPTYKLGEAVIDCADTTTYLGVIVQSNFKFDQHIALKKDKASKTVGAIKHILKQAPQKGRLLAYTSLCRPILEYADTVCDPTLAKEVESLEMLQHSCLIHCQIERTGECYGGVP